MFRKAADEDDEKNKLEEDLEELRMDNLVLQNQVWAQYFWYFSQESVVNSSPPPPTTPQPNPKASALD